jgi:hypothetical protein
MKGGRIILISEIFNLVVNKKVLPESTVIVPILADNLIPRHACMMEGVSDLTIKFNQDLFLNLVACKRPVCIKSAKPLNGIRIVIYD